MPRLLTGLDHLQIAIPPGGEDEGRKFYGDILGFREVAKPPELAKDGVWFEQAGVRLHLGVDPQFVPARKAHPGFTTDAMDDVSKRLIAAGFPAEKDTRLPGTTRIFTADPFGNRIEVLES